MLQPGAAERRFDVLWDGDCGLCGAAAGLLERLDQWGKLRVRPWQADARTASDAGLRQMCERALVLITPTGQRFEGVDAVIAIGSLLGWRKLSQVAALPGVHALGAHCYRSVAANRALLSRFLLLQSCRVRDQTVNSRA